MVFAPRRAFVVLFVALLAAGSTTTCSGQEDKPETPEEHLAKGDEAMASDDAQGAIASYENGIDVSDPSRPDAILVALETNLATAYVGIANETALEHYAKAIEASDAIEKPYAREASREKTAEAHFRFADLVKGENVNLAAKHFLRVPQLVEGYWEAWVKVGLICEDLYDHKMFMMQSLSDSLDIMKENAGDDEKAKAEIDQMVADRDEHTEEAKQNAWMFQERALKALIKGYTDLNTMDKDQLVNYPEDDYEATLSRIQLAIGRSAVKTSGENCANVIADAEEKIYCKALAIKAYERAVEHDPTNESAKEFLEKMNDEKSKKIAEMKFVKEMLKTYDTKRKASAKDGHDEL